MCRFGIPPRRLLVAGVLFGIVVAAAPSPAGRYDGSIWSKRDLYRNRKASEVGDLVTILINESASAGSQAQTKMEEGAQQNGGVGSGTGLFKWIDAFSLGTSSSNNYEGKGSTSRQGSLNARMSAAVVEKLPNGVLRVSGTREVMVNQEKQRLTLTGLVRPEDVRADNTVLSSFLAEARISFDGKGTVHGAQSPGILTRILGLLF